MKRLLMIMLVFAVGAGVYAQDNFFPSRAGTVLTYADNDARGNAQGYTVLTIKDVKGSGRNMNITFVGTSLDKNRRPIKDSGEQVLHVTIKDGVLIMDVNQMVPTQIKQQGVKIEAKGIPMELPNTLKPGQTIKDSEVTVSMDLGIMKVNSVAKLTEGKCLAIQAIKDSEVTVSMDLGIMKVNSVAKLTEGKCLAIEDVRVPAGTFKCHKITQKITTTAMNTSTVTKVITWYAPNIGTVKSETYDDKNKLVSGSVLVELKR